MTIATPAEGPSFGTAPCGHVDVEVERLEVGGGRGRAPRAWLRSQERAASADSRITSPSEPVSSSSPLPGMRVRLDEQDVAARRASRRGPTATPGRPARSASSGSKRTGPSRSGQLLAARTRIGAEPRPRRRAARSCGTPRRSPARGCARRPRACSCGSAPAASSSGISSVDARDVRSPRAAAAAGSAARSRACPPPCSPGSSITSMRSRSAGGTGSITLAVAMNSTCERSKGTSR